jgi:hypothetical protein
MWEVTPVFRDSVTGQLGLGTSQSMLDTRSGLTPQNEDTTTLSFGTFYYGGVSNPTHVSLVVSRLGTHLSDTMADDAHLVEVTVTLPRD